MNNISEKVKNNFDSARFGHCMCYELRSQKKRNLLFLAVFFGAFLAIVLLSCGDRSYIVYEYDYDPTRSMMEVMFWFGLAVFEVIAASLAFTALVNKSSKIQYLMLPATTFEKFLVQWIVYIPLATFIYLVGYEMIDIIRVVYIKMTWNHSDAVDLMIANERFVSDITDFRAICFFVFAQSMYFLGAVVWPRYSAVKTSLALFCIFVAYLVANLTLVSGMLHLDWLFRNSNGAHFLNVNNELIFCLVVGAFYLMSVVAWVIAYYRLKEEEVIRRW